MKHHLPQWRRSRYLFGIACTAVALSHCLPAALHAQATDPLALDDSIKRESLAVTIYNDDLGVVRDVRDFRLDRGHNTIKLIDVPQRIDPTTVKVTALNNSGFTVLEQNYEYDLVDQAKLLGKYVDHPITLLDDKGAKLEGTLLATGSDELTLRTTTGIVMLPTIKRYSISVPTLPQGLITRPTLVWGVDSRDAIQSQPVELVYHTSGLTWHAEYVAALSDDDASLDLTGWVSLENTSGASYPNAKLKLVAGQVHRAPLSADSFQGNTSRLAISDISISTQFEEHGLFEYHVYDLQHPTTIKQNETKQVSLLSATGVRATKHYTYSGGKNVDVTIDFVNSQANHMGMPIPMGTVRVMKRDKDGTLEFVGEDHIEHTPRDEKITLNVGAAFDLLGERVVTDSRTYGPHSNRQSLKITLKNRKDEDVTIDVEEYVGENWRITESSVPFDKKDASTIVFHVPVAHRSEQTITYSVFHRY